MSGMTTVTQSTAPDWLRPQIEQLIGAAQQHIFDYGNSGTTAAPATQTNVSTPQTSTYDIYGDNGPRPAPTGDAQAGAQYTPLKVREFVPWRQDAREYVAPFSALQNQAFNAAQQFQVPNQFGAASDLAAQSGYGAYNNAGIASMYGNRAAGLAPWAQRFAFQQGNAGNQFAQQATNPYAIQAYMSPYMQNVVDVQQQQAQRQADIQNQTAKAQFAQAGGLGGGRYGVQQGLQAANLARQKADIQSQGLQSAFNNAQQQQQFGANLGLQGLAGATQSLGQAGNLYGAGAAGAQTAGQLYGQATQSANALGNLGQQQFNTQQGIIGLQNTLGQQQQAYEQNIINNRINNYAQAQQYPMQQLDAFNALVRGYAVPTQSSVSYQAAPALGSQIAGLATAGYGLSQMGKGQAEGGPVRAKRMATGGIAELNRKVLLDPDRYSLQQIAQGVRSGSISDLIGAPVLAQKTAQQQQFQRDAQAAQAPQGQPPILQQLLQAADMQRNAPGGVPSLPSQLPPQGMKAGGIVAFQTGGMSEYPVQTTGSAERMRNRLSTPALGLPGVFFGDVIGAGETDLEPVERPPYAGRRYPSKYSPPEYPAPKQAVTAGVGGAGGAGNGSDGIGGFERTLERMMGKLPQLPSSAPDASLRDFKEQLGVFERSRAAADAAHKAELEKLRGAVPGQAYEEYEKSIRDAVGKTNAEREEAKNAAIFKAGLAMMGGTSPFAAVNIGKGATAGLEDYQLSAKEIKKAEAEHRKILADIAQARRAESIGDRDKAIELLKDARARQDALDTLRLTGLTGAKKEDLSRGIEEYKARAQPASHLLGAGISGMAHLMAKNAEIKAANARADARAGAMTNGRPLSEYQRFQIAQKIRENMPLQQFQALWLKDKNYNPAALKDPHTAERLKTEYDAYVNQEFYKQMMLAQKAAAAPSDIPAGFSHP